MCVCMCVCVCVHVMHIFITCMYTDQVQVGSHVVLDVIEK